MVQKKERTPSKRVPALNFYVIENPVERRVIRAAHSLIKRFGPEKVTMADVAKAAGVSRATLYNYFRTRADLLKAVHIGIEREFFDRIRNGPEELESLTDRLTRAGLVLRSWRSDGVFRTGMFGLGEVSSGVLPTPVFARTARFWAPYVQTAALSGELSPDRDVDLTCDLIARFSFSLIFPAGAVDVDKVEELRALVRALLDVAQED